MIFNKPHLLTEMDIWAPRYNDQYKDGQERVVLLAKYKVDHATTWIKITFTKAKHLIGQRYCVERDYVQSCSVDSNGTIPCYVVPMSKLEGWDSGAEVKRIANELFPD